MTAAGVVPALWEVTAAVPVPLHRLRLRQRGYNQAEIIASTLARTLTLPLQPAWLSRTRHTRAQVGLNTQERAANLTHAFTAGPLPPSMRILLVDDVTKTGATFDVCARTLVQAGAESVFGIAIARED